MYRNRCQCHRNRRLSHMYLWHLEARVWYDCNMIGCLEPPLSERIRRRALTPMWRKYSPQCPVCIRAHRRGRAHSA